MNIYAKAIMRFHCVLMACLRHIGVTPFNAVIHVHNGKYYHTR